MVSSHKFITIDTVRVLLEAFRQELKSLQANTTPCSQQQASELLRRFDELARAFMQYESLFENSVQGFFISTTKGEGVDCNHAFARMLGYDSPEELRQIKDFGQKHYVNPQERPRNIQILREKGRLLNRETRLKRRDGKPIWALVNVQLTEEDLIEGISIDITDKKHAEQQLKQSEEKYRRIVETAAEGFLLMDEALTIIDVNEAYCKLIGYAHDEILGKTPLDFSTEEFGQFIMTNKEKLLSGDIREFEGSLVAKDGRNVPILVHNNTLRDDQGAVIGNMSFVTDMTEHKKSLVLAGEVQRSLLPQENPNIQGLDLAGKIITCEEIGGDYFDFLWGTDCLEDPFGVVVGDVTGHGVDAALLMTTARAFLRMRASQCGSISQIITEMNRHLAQDVLDTGRFMTLFYLTIDPENKRLSWVRAGHEPALIYDPTLDKFDELKGIGLALGVDEEVSYQENHREGLVEGQIIAIGTDGIWEARDKDGDMFGKARFQDIIRRNASAKAEAILAAVYDELERFRSGLKPEDDVTLVVLKIEE
jgi:sigma-B regulation protein RsbU (phosphoserine phosphatase)